MEAEQQPQMGSSLHDSKTLTMYFDGAGCRPNGEGSGFAWICPETGQRRVERVKELTNNQAEYRGFLAAVQSVPQGSTVEMFSDSELVCSQFNGHFRVKDYELQELLAEILTLIFSKNLKLKL